MKGISASPVIPGNRGPNLIIGMIFPSICSCKYLLFFLEAFFSNGSYLIPITIIIETGLRACRSAPPLLVRSRAILSIIRTYLLFPVDNYFPLSTSSSSSWIVFSIYYLPKLKLIELPIDLYSLT